VGDRFFSQGERATKFHLLIEGQVRITQVTPDGQQILLRLIGPDQIFGGIEAIRSGEYPASAEALVPCVALVWSGETLQDLLERFPRIARNMILLMADQFQTLQDRLRELTTERVERRIAHTLLRLIRHAGRKIEEGILLDLPLTRQDLAEMSGTTLYTVSRILSRWEMDGIVKSERQRVVICIPHQLVTIAEDLPPGPAGDRDSN
jgi:CRP-like cAMP-binding protein